MFGGATKYTPMSYVPDCASFPRHLGRHSPLRLRYESTRVAVGDRTSDYREQTHEGAGLAARWVTKSASSTAYLATRVEHWIVC